MTPDEHIAEILGRYTVTDLIEQTETDLEHGDELFYAAKGDITIVEKGQRNAIWWWRVRSGKAVYECRRFKNFVWCQCRGFYFSKRMCKHLALTTGVFCIGCRQLRAQIDKLCFDCDVKQNHFLKPPEGYFDAKQTREINL